MKRFLGMMLVGTLIFAGVVGCGGSGVEQQKKNTQTNLQETNNTRNEENNESEGLTKKKLVVATEPLYKPMEYLENDEIVGFAPDLVKELGKEMGMEIEIINEEWDNIFNKLYAKEYDLVVSSVSITEKRKESMTFSDSYFESQAVIITRNDRNINSTKDLTGKTFGVQEGTYFVDLVKNNIPGVNFKYTASVEELFILFEENSIDAIMVDSPVGFSYLKEKNDSNYVVIDKDELFETDNFGIVARKDPESKEFINEINKALEKLRENGKYQEIYGKYF